jgi:phosphomannomutase
VYEITGPFAFERNDLHLTEEVKNKIVANCKANAYTSFGKYQVQRVEDLDGWKFFISDEEWIMIRASGTEPVLRTYAETSSRELAFEMLEACKKTLLG